MATSNTAIKITSLPNIGNNIAPSTLIPVVNMAGVPTTQKANLQITGNLILAGAGTANFVPAGLANLAYTVVNSNQPNITRVGTLNVSTLKILGGTNGQYIQTDGAGNLSWVSGGGSGNGVVGGANTQIQYNNAGNFGGSPSLVWDQANALFSTTNIGATHATIYGNIDTINVNATGNVKPNAIYTDHYYYANGYVFGGGGGNGVPGGASSQVQFNDGGVFGGNTGFTFNKTSGLLSATLLAGGGNGLSNIQGANVSGFVANANVANTAKAVAGANVTGEVAHAASANSVAVANVVGLGNIATVALNGSSSQVLYGNGQWGAASTANTGNVTFDNQIVIGTGDSGGYGGLYLAPGNTEQLANSGYFRVRGGDVATHLHFDTGNNAYYDQYFGDDNKYVKLASTGNIVINSNDSNGNSAMWTFSTDGNLTTPGDSGNITGANVIEANTFLGTGNLKLQPDPNNNGAYLDVYLTGGPDVHIAGNGETVIVGSDAGANVSVQASGNVAIQANAYFGGTPHHWTFDYYGNLTLPDNTVLQNGGGIEFPATEGEWDLHSSNGKIYIGALPSSMAYIDTYDANISVRIRTLGNPEEGPGYDWIFDPTGNLTLPSNTFSINYANGHQVQLGGGSTYGNSNVATFLASYGSNTISTTGNVKTGLLIAPASDNGSIIFSNNGTDTNGSFKVDGGLNMTISANSNFYVKRAGSDRLAITDTNTDLMASSNVVIHANKAGSEQNWTFDTTGKLTTPGDIDMFGGVISFHQQVGNITWGTSYMAFSQYGRINTNVDFFANANTIGADVLKTNSIIVSGNANVSGNLVLSSTTQIVSTPGSNGNITLDPDGTGVVNVLGNVVANNFSGNITITGNINGTSPNVTLVAGSYSYTFDNTGVLTLPAQGIGPSNEGAEIDFTKAPNSSLSGNVVAIDQYVDRIRFFESGGSVRGAYIDLSIAAAGVGTLLNNRASGIVNAGVDVTLGNLKARIPTSGNRSLQISTVSGTYSVFGAEVYNAGSGISGAYIDGSAQLSVTTSPAYLRATNNFTAAGYMDTWNIYDPSAGLAWRITCIIGLSYNNNMISIERLV